MEPPLIAFCLVLALMTGNQAWVIEKPIPVIHRDADICTLASKEMGMNLRAYGIARGLVSQATCGCMGVEEAYKLKILPRTIPTEEAEHGILW